jgi:mRNA interferase HigB
LGTLPFSPVFGAFRVPGKGQVIDGLAFLDLDNFAFCEVKFSVHVISKKAWRDAVKKDPTLEAPINAWYKVAKNATWRNIAEVRAVYPHADFRDPDTIFNIKGNAYRLIVKIEYQWQMIFVRRLITHAEYTKEG